MECRHLKAQEDGVLRRVLVKEWPSLDLLKTGLSVESEGLQIALPDLQERVLNAQSGRLIEQFPEEGPAHSTPAPGERHREIHDVQIGGVDADGDEAYGPSSRAEREEGRRHSTQLVGKGLRGPRLRGGRIDRNQGIHVGGRGGAESQLRDGVGHAAIALWVVS